MSKKSTVLSFIAGASISGVITWFYTREYYYKKADQEIEDVRQAYADKLEEAGIGKHEKAEPYEGEDIKPGEEPIVVFTKEEKDARRKAIKKFSNPPLTDYMAMYKSKNAGNNPKDEMEAEDEDVEETFTEEVGEVDAIDEAELEHPEDDLEEAMNPSDGELEDSNLEVKAAAERGDAPYIITEDEYYNERPEFEKMDLMYHLQTTVVTNDSDEEVEDYEDLIGGCLSDIEPGKDQSFEDNDEEELYVRNVAMGVDFCVMKLFQD